MRIMLINHYAGSDLYGMEFRPYYMAREWVKAGHEVVIIAADFTHLRTKNPSVEHDFTEEDISGIKYLWIKTPKYKGNGFARARNMAAFTFKLRMNTTLLAEKYKPDAVIASSTYPFDMYPAASIAKKSNAGLFFEIHDLWPLTQIESYKLSKFNPYVVLLQAAENYAYKHAHKYISILPAVDKYIKLRGYDCGKFVHIPNGVIPQNFSTELTEDPQIKTLKALHDDGWFLVGYTGNHSAANSLEYFMESSTMLEGLKVKIVLLGSGNYKDVLISRAKQAKYDNVVFLDPVPKKSMGAVLSLMDVCFMGLSKSNLFKYGVSPNKLYDYLLAKKPVIYAVEASNDPVSAAGCGITVPAADSKAIADAIKQLQSLTKQQCDELGEKGYEYVIANHDYAMLAKKFIEAIKL